MTMYLKIDLDIQKLFHSERVTEQILELQSQIPSTLENFREDP